MSGFTNFSPKAPESFTVKANAQTLITRRTSEGVHTVLCISNNSDVPVYLGFTAPKAEQGNAKVNHGITVFPKSVLMFDDPVPNGCAIWATCASGEAIIGVQQ